MRWWFDWLDSWRFPHRDEQAQVEAERHPAPVKQAASRVLHGGRSISIAYDEKGAHLRRRPKQIRREFGVGFTLYALAKDLRYRYQARRRRLPWWWL